MIPVMDDKPCPRCGGSEFIPMEINPKAMVKEFKKCKKCGWAKQTDPLDGGVVVGKKHQDIEP